MRAVFLAALLAGSWATTLQAEVCLTFGIAPGCIIGKAAHDYSEVLGWDAGYNPNVATWLGTSEDNRPTIRETYWLNMPVREETWDPAILTEAEPQLAALRTDYTRSLIALTCGQNSGFDVIERASFIKAGGAIEYIIELGAWNAANLPGLPHELLRVRIDTCEAP